jgi:hypothetical protein
VKDRTCSVEDCDKSGKLTRGLCGKHYYHWLKNTPRDERPPAPRFARDFWAFVAKTHEHGCWTWNGPSDRKGYGRWGREVASRHSWELANGPIGMNDAGQDYATAADLARIYRVALGTIYRWASEDGWKRTPVRPIRYHRGDAQRSYDRRKLTTP